MSPQREIFASAIDHFAAEQEEIRAAAAFAAGQSCPYPVTVLILIYLYHRKHCHR